MDKQTMNSIKNLVADMQSQGVALWLENEKLKFRAPRQILTTITATLKNHKEEIIRYLSEAQPMEKRLPLTPIQYAYLLGSSDEYELGNTNAHYYLEYEKEHIDVTRLENALNQIVCAADALRFRVMPAGYQYLMESTPKIRIEMYDVQNDEALMNIRNKWQRQVYFPGEWPMFRFAVSQMPEKDVLHISFDCIILDATSAKLMIERLFQLYDGEEVSFPDYTFQQYLMEKQTLEMNSKVQKDAETYWADLYPIMPAAPDLRYVKSFSEVVQPEFLRFEYSFSKEETAALVNHAKQHHVTLASIICTIFLKTLSAWAASPALTLNLTLFNRHMVHPEIHTVLGEFTNIGFVSFPGNEGKDFLSEVSYVQKQFWKLLEFREYDGTKVLKKLARGKTGKAIMPVVFTCVLGGAQANDLKTDFKEVYSLSRTPQVCLDHHVRDDQGLLKLSWDYISELFSPEYIKGMFADYIDLVYMVCKDTDWSTSSYQLVAGQRNKIHPEP